MLFPRPVLDRIGAGEVTVAFRRWKRPRVRPGTRLRTAAGVLAVEAVDVVEPHAISAADVRRAGFGSRDELLAALTGREGDLYRIALRLAGPDPRLALREDVTRDQLAEVAGRLDRIDASSRHGPWTAEVLQAIGDRPGVPAAELAADFGRERLAFKADVRKLKELGLTESLLVGYRLSPRGQAVLAARSPHSG
jgi:hypothetical protein